MTPTNRHDKCLELILEHGADVNNVNKEGTPVFTVACELAAEYQKLCLELLKKGADPNCADEVKSRRERFDFCMKFLMYNFV